MKKLSIKMTQWNRRDFGKFSFLSLAAIVSGTAFGCSEDAGGEKKKKPGKAGSGSKSPDKQSDEGSGSRDKSDRGSDSR